MNDKEAWEQIAEWFKSPTQSLLATVLYDEHSNRWTVVLGCAGGVGSSLGEAVIMAIESDRRGFASCAGGERT